MNPKSENMANAKHTTAAALFFEQHKEVIPYHSAYLLAQKENVADKIQRLQLVQPSLPLTKVISLILDELPENMAPRLVRELTLFIIESWENMPSEVVETA